MNIEEFSHFLRQNDQPAAAMLRRLQDKLWNEQGPGGPGNDPTQWVPAELRI